MDQLRGPTCRMTFELSAIAAKLTATGDKSEARNNFIIDGFTATKIATLIYAGSREKTGELLRENLGLDSLFDSRFTLEKVTYAFRRALHILTANQSNGECKCHFDSHIYYAHDLELFKGFQETAEKYFGYQFHQLRSNHGMTIKSSKSDSFDSMDNIPTSETRPPPSLWMINSSSMNAHWRTPFKATYEIPFHLTNHQTINVDMMHTFDSFPYYEDRHLGMKYLEIPMANNEYSTCLILPSEIRKNLIRKRVHLSDLDKDLTPETFLRLAKLKKLRKVDVLLPKFRAESSFDLKKLFRRNKLGIIFREEANLMGISLDPDLTIKGALHHSTLDLNEKGIQMGDDTPLGKFEPLKVRASLQRPSDPRIYTFHADHSFMFLIRHNKSGIIIFSGHINNPRNTDCHGQFQESSAFITTDSHNILFRRYG